MNREKNMEITGLFKSLPEDVRNYFTNCELSRRTHSLNFLTGEPLIEDWEGYEYHKKRITELCKNTRDYENSIKYLIYILGI
jgi:hypothetical protein